MDIHLEADYKRALTQLTVLMDNELTSLEPMLALRDASRTYGRAQYNKPLIFNILLGGLKVVMRHY